MATKNLCNKAFPVPTLTIGYRSWKSDDRRIINASVVPADRFRVARCKLTEGHEDDHEGVMPPTKLKWSNYTEINENFWKVKCVKDGETVNP